MIRNIVACTAIFTALGLLGATISAHPRATLKSDQASVAAGSTVSIVGSEFQSGETVRLVLKGALAEFPIREMAADDEGEFALEFTVPADVRPGEYRLVAVAADGDEVATLDLAVMPVMESAEEGAPAHAMAGGATTTPLQARADGLPIERNMDGIAWGVIGLMLGLSAGLGITLIWRTRPSAPLGVDRERQGERRPESMTKRGEGR